MLGPPIDCGADIGIFFALVGARADRLSRVVAFEPNTEVLSVLEMNLGFMSAPSQLVPKAVSYFEGRGRLERPRYDSSDHARFLVPGEGPVEVTTVDAQGVRGGDVAIKIDVEGGELEVLKGATETIRAARECVVTVEAHYQVAKRVGRDPSECLKYLESIRPFRFAIAETGEPVSGAHKILDQNQGHIWNVVGWTHNAENRS